MAVTPRFSWAHLGLVVLGGMLGTAARAGLLLIDGPAWQEVAIPVVNLAGSFLLGVLTGVLSLRADTAASRASRQFLGAGVLGGFTTYSAFAVQAVQSAPLWVSFGTAVAGVAVALAGIVLARLGTSRRVHSTPEERA